MSEPKDRVKALQEALAKIDKTYGKGAIIRVGDKTIEKVKTTSSGSIGLDEALGGGYRVGGMVEIYGPESSGKTTLATHAIAECQKRGGTAAFIDAEHAYDFFYAAKLGVNTDNLLFSQPSNGEEALEIADTLIESGAVDIIVIDSVAALTPKAEIDGEIGDAQMGKQARMMGQAMRKLVAKTSKNNVTLIFLNQLREKLGVMFGNPEITTGGNALKFYASQRLDIRRNAQIKGTEKDAEVEGSKVKVKVIKNKIAPPFRFAEFDIIFGEGISKVGELIDVGVDRGILQKTGGWVAYEGSKLGNGRDQVKQLLMDNPELMDEIELKIREAV